MLPPTTILVIVSFALIILPSALAALSVARRRKSEEGHGFYEDVDGVATEQSQKEFSAKGPIIALLVLSILGLSASFALAISSTFEGHHILLPTWLLTGIHVAVAVQSINVALEQDSVRRFHSSIQTALCHAIVAITASLLFTQWKERPVRALLLVDLLCAIAAFISGLLVPRRPAVFLEGKPVDGERTVSLLNRLTFTWMADLVNLVRAKSWLVMDDVPVLGYQGRAGWLLKTHPELLPEQTLFNLILRCHGGGLAAQYFLTLMDGVTVQAPSVALLFLLRTLEQRHADGDQDAPVAVWVVLLGVFLFLTQFIESVQWYISYSYIQVPFRTHLSALVYAKALRRKDVKGVADVSGTAENEETENKTQQGTVNLVGVDVFRVSYFALVNNWFFGAFIKIIISFSLLGYLVGWQALLAGLFVQLMSMPLNTYFSKKYAKAQNDVMKVRDQKLAVVTEILKGIRHVKFAAHEEKVENQIREVRNKELGEQWKAFKADIGLMFCWLFGPIMLSSVALAVHALVNGELLPSVAFTTMGVLNSIQVTLALIPELATQAIDAWVSLKRVEKYLHAPERPEVTSPGSSVAFKNADFAWPVDDQEAKREFVIRQTNLSFPNYELSIIAGGTGSGKSLMLAAILGETDLLSGVITVPKAMSEQHDDSQLLNDTNWIQSGTLAFVSQQPWIENATFKDNILFGLPFSHKRYEEVVSACALTQDRKILSDGDDTEIGANGINVSGGQKWRITLARALYSRAEILIMDDIFSAVDAHVGRHIFTNALCGKIGAGRTRILATHHVSLVMASAKYAVHLSNGQVEYSGSIDQLKQTGALQAILLEEDKDHETAVEDAEEPGHVVITEGDNEGTGTVHREAGYQPINASPNLTANRRRSSARKSSASARPDGITEDDGESRTAAPKKFVEDESRQTGRIAISIYTRYFKASGYIWFWAGYAGILMVLEILRLGQSWWVKLWTQSYETEDVPKAHHISHQQQFLSIGTSNQTIQIHGVDPSLRYYLGIYFGFACLLLVAGIIRSVFMFTGSIRASRKLYEDLTYQVLRAKLRWWDTMPLGRILNRFTSDFTIVDGELCWTLCTVFDQALVILGIIVAGILVSPYVVVFSFLLIAISLKYSLYYLDGTREMKRLESIAKSPIFEILGTTLSGLGTIRAFKKTETYTQNMFAKIDVYGATSYYIAGMNRWLSIRLGLIGSIFAVIIAIIVTSIKDFDPSLAGFALSFALQYSDAIYWMLRQFGITEMAMNSVERIQEYTETEIEDQSGKPAPAAWPSKGRLEIDGLVVGYAEDLPPVLRGISLGIEPNERCAIVGRTGAGKSSMALALFRFLAAREGRIVIDGIDIASLRLRDLRSRLAIIPQDPVLFSGSVRSNLDPFSEHSDDALREALERVHLIKANDSGSSTPPTTLDTSSESTQPTATSSTNVNPFASLSTTIAESGSNLSQGQRQLLCLARAILHRPKILILDEATSAVDKATDTLIQQSIREQFSDSTLLVIAHRLSTIADFDRVCVLGEGKVLEYDKPEVLMRKEQGAFRGMVEESGEKEVIQEMLFGRKR